jgi:hypothetical protein
VRLSTRRGSCSVQSQVANASEELPEPGKARVIVATASWRARLSIADVLLGMNRKKCRFDRKQRIIEHSIFVATSHVLRGASSWAMCRESVFSSSCRRLRRSPNSSRGKSDSRSSSPLHPGRTDRHCRASQPQHAHDLGTRKAESARTRFGKKRLLSRAS